MKIINKASFFFVGFEVKFNGLSKRRASDLLKYIIFFLWNGNSKLFFRLKINVWRLSKYKKVDYQK